LCWIENSVNGESVSIQHSLRDTILLTPIYSRRKRQAEATGQDVYNYNVIPTRVRVQVVQMLEAGLGSAGRSTNMGEHVDNPCYEHIVKSMRLELDVHRLTDNKYANFQKELFLWLQQESNIDHWLDGVELSLQTMERWMSAQELSSLYRPSAKPNSVITEFNARLLEAAVGYQYVSGEIVRIDSQRDSLGHLASETNESSKEFVISTPCCISLDRSNVYSQSDG
jgi:hypothetical protein